MTGLIVISAGGMGLAVLLPPPPRTLVGLKDIMIGVINVMAARAQLIAYAAQKQYQHDKGSVAAKEGEKQNGCMILE